MHCVVLEVPKTADPQSCQLTSPEAFTPLGFDVIGVDIVSTSITSFKIAGVEQLSEPLTAFTIPPVPAGDSMPDESGPYASVALDADITLEVSGNFELIHIWGEKT